MMGTGPERNYRRSQLLTAALALNRLLISAAFFLLFGCGRHPLTRDDSEEINCPGGICTWISPVPVLSKFRYGPLTGSPGTFVYPSGRRFVRTHESYALGAEPGEVYTGLFEGRESSGVVVRSSELFFEGNDGAGVDDCLNAFTIDVGWGDAHLISFPGGRTVLIDCGSSRHIDYLRRFLDDNPTNSGGVIDALVLTHPHEDHIGGALGDLDSAGDGLLEACFVRRILIPDIRPVDYPLLDEIARYADRQGIPVYRLKAGDSEATRPDVLDWDPAVNVQVLNSGSAAGEENINNVSLVLKLTYGEIDILLTGDAEEEVENHLLSLYAGTGVLSCEILKLSHHGSDDANSPSFLKAVSPRVAILSVDSGEVGWSLPDPSVINNLECLLTDLFRTDKRWTEGPFLKSNIRVSTDGTVFEVRYIDP